MNGSVDHEPLREQVADAARECAAHGLLVGTAGNVSARHGDVVAVTASGVVLARCRPQDVVVVSAYGEVLDDTARRPTSELGLHLGVLADTGAAAVVHTHAPWSTAVACVLDVLPVLHYQQVLLGGEIRVAPYATFGSSELADHVRAALVDRQAALMAHHGSVAIGGSLTQAVENAVLLEWLAALHHRVSALGTPHPLTAAQQEDVVRAALEGGYGSLPTEPQEHP